MTGIVHNRRDHRFELGIADSDAVATAWYRDDANGHRLLTHTEVPGEFSGQGIGSRLARAVFDDARANGIKLVLECPFLASWFARHPEYADVVAG
jgi:predicted GNAT family acetyltransferase